MVESQVSCLSSWDERFGLPRNTLHQNLQVATGEAGPWQEDDFKTASQTEGALASGQEMFAEVCAAHSLHELERITLSLNLNFPIVRGEVVRKAQTCQPHLAFLCSNSPSQTTMPQKIQAELYIELKFPCFQNIRSEHVIFLMGSEQPKISCH